MIADTVAGERCIKTSVCFFWISFICIAFYTAFTANKGFFLDTVEHIHSSWLVSEGKVPYRDFFQHHNLLLWYLYVPIAKLFYQDPLIFPVSKGVGSMGYLAVIWLIYVINKRFIYGAKTARLSLLILLSVPFIWNDLTTFRPDIFMYVCFFGALYSFFSYLENHNLLKLALSYFLLALSALFLQKILFICIGFFGLNLYYLYHKKIPFFHLVVAGVCYVIPWALLFGFLAANNILAEWYYYNFEFNFLMKEYYSGYTSGFSSTLPFITLLSVIVILRNYDATHGQSVLLTLYLFSLLSVILFAPHSHYFTLYWFFASILLGNILYHTKYFKYAYLFVLAAAFINLCQLLPTTRQKEAYQNYLNNMDYLWKQNLSGDDFLSLTKITYHPFIPNSSYYWYGYHNVAIIDTIYNRKQYFDLKNELESQKPLFIVFETSSLLGLNDMLVFNKRKYFIRRNAAILRKAQKHPELLSKLITIDSDFWKIDEKWVERNYDRIDGTIIWKRKDMLK